MHRWLGWKFLASSSLHRSPQQQPLPDSSKNTHLTLGGAARLACSSLWNASSITSGAITKTPGGTAKKVVPLAWGASNLVRGENFLRRQGLEPRILLESSGFGGFAVVRQLVGFVLITQSSMSEIQTSRAVLTALKALQQKVRHLEVRGVSGYPWGLEDGRGVSLE